MTSARDLSIPKLNKNVRQALRIWHQESSEESPLDDLGLFHQFLRQGRSIRKATNNVLFQGLKVLEKDDPKQADLLRYRFIDEQPAYEVANSLNISESYVFALQRKAIMHLAKKLKVMEETANADRETKLIKRLNLPTYLDLVGADEHLSKLREVFVTPKLPWVVALCGIGGIGKTSLADALIRDIINKGLFHDFGWVTAQQRIFNLGGSIKMVNKPALTTDALVEALVEQLLDLTPAQFSGKQAFDALQNTLKERPHLIVIDNLETMQDVESLLPTLRRFANPTKFLLTSRKGLYSEADVYHFTLPELSEPYALQLIRQEATVRNLPQLKEKNDQELRPIYETVGGNPLALRLIVGQTHFHHLSVILSDLQAARGESVENLYNYIYRRAWDNLDKPTRHLFLAMPLLPERGGVLSHMAHVSQLSPSTLRQSLRLLMTLNLVNVSHESTESRYTIHSLTRTFLQEQVAKWQ